MAEEHGFQAQEGHRLCANNCGFFGNLTSSDLCSKCQRDLRMKEEQNAIAKSAFDDNNNSAKHSPASPSLMPAPLTSSIIIPTLKLPEAATTATAAERADLPPPNRCGSCRKRVGLTGFKCRCGSTFCGSHRYAEQHGCRFDYKAMAKDAIAKANPVVKAAKLQRI